MRVIDRMSPSCLLLGIKPAIWTYPLTRNQTLTFGFMGDAQSLIHFLQFCLFTICSFAFLFTLLGHHRVDCECYSDIIRGIMVNLCLEGMMYFSRESLIHPWRCFGEPPACHRPRAMGTFLWGHSTAPPAEAALSWFWKLSASGRFYTIPTASRWWCDVSWMITELLILFLNPVPDLELSRTLAPGIPPGRIIPT